MQRNSARYSYEWIRGHWYVYDNQLNRPMKCYLHDREEARKEVYRLNGWNYKPQKIHHNEKVSDNHHRHG